jgi:hypothetical protein
MVGQIAPTVAPPDADTQPRELLRPEVLRD